MKPGLLALAFASLLLAGLASASATEPGGAPDVEPARVVVEVGDAPRLGPDDAPVTIVEFSDFSCVYCARMTRVLRAIHAAYPTQVRIVFKHFPWRGRPAVDRLHEAAAAAGEQGKFWAMHKLIFANSRRTSRDDLLAYADALGLDVARFVQALDGRRLRGRILRDIAQGRQLHVSATPTYFINGLRVVGSRNVEELRAFIERELHRQAPASGAAFSDHLCSAGAFCWTMARISSTALADLGS